MLLTKTTMEHNSPDHLLNSEKLSITFPRDKYLNTAQNLLCAFQLLWAQVTQY